MKRIAAMFAAGTFALMVGCSDGIEFNGEAQVQQFPIRTTPIIHYPLPTEHPTTGELDYTLFAPIDTTIFQELASPGHDLWAIALEGGSIFHCSDNPTCNTPGPVPDWSYLMVGYVGVGPISQTVVWPPQGNWPHPQIQGGAAHQQVGGWVLSFANQWFLRELDGAERPPQVLGKAPIKYESVEFSSLPISIHEGDAAGSGFSPLLLNQLPGGEQQQTGDPTTTGPNGAPRIAVPVNNMLGWGYNGIGAPEGLMGMGWQEPWAQNRSIETTIASYQVTPIILKNVPVADYHGGGSIPSTANGGGGIYGQRFVDDWVQVTDGNTVLPTDDGLSFSYYAAVVVSHLIGFGVGLVDSSFASPGVINDEEDIMGLSVMLDMTAFIASQKKFQFVTEDLMRMQDVVNGDWADPGPLSTLPGSDRELP